MKDNTLAGRALASIETILFKGKISRKKISAEKLQKIVSAFGDPHKDGTFNRRFTKFIGGNISELQKASDFDYSALMQFAEDAIASKGKSVTYQAICRYTDLSMITIKRAVLSGALRRTNKTSRPALVDPASVFIWKYGNKKPPSIPADMARESLWAEMLDKPILYFPIPEKLKEIMNYLTPPEMKMIQAYIKTKRDWNKNGLYKDRIGEEIYLSVYASFFSKDSRYGADQMIDMVFPLKNICSTCSLYMTSRKNIFENNEHNNSDDKYLKKDNESGIYKDTYIYRCKYCGELIKSSDMRDSVEKGRNYFVQKLTDWIPEDVGNISDIECYKRAHTYIKWRSRTQRIRISDIANTMLTQDEIEKYGLSMGRRIKASNLSASLKNFYSKHGGKEIFERRFSRIIWMIDVGIEEHSSAAYIYPRAFNVYANAIAKKALELYPE